MQLQNCKRFQNYVLTVPRGKSTVKVLLNANIQSLDSVDSAEELDGCFSLHSLYFTPYLAVRLATHNFYSVPLLLCCALLQLVGPKETNAAQVGAVTALRGGHEGRRNQKNLKQRKIDIPD